MKRILTPFLFIVIAIIIYSIYTLFTDDSGWGIIFAVYAIPVVLLIWLFDFGLKKYTKSSKFLLGIEFLIIAIAIGIYQYGERVKTLEIPSQSEIKFVTIIYGVDKEKDLGISVFHWFKTIQIPNDGILFTSSDFEENLPLTKIKFDSGVYLDSEESDLSFGEMDASQLTFNGKTYKYRSWTLQKGYCCTFPKEDEITVKNSLKTKLTRWENRKSRN